MFTITLRSDLYRFGVNLLTGMFICSSTCVAENKSKSKSEFNFTACFFYCVSSAYFSIGFFYGVGIFTVTDVSSTRLKLILIPY